MGNGAVFHRVNWMGNPGLSGLRASAGLMVNYLYDLPALENNKEVFREQPQQQQNSDRAGGSVLEEAAASELPHLALGDQVKSILLDN